MVCDFSPLPSRPESSNIISVVGGCFFLPRAAAVDPEQGLARCQGLCLSGRSGQMAHCSVNLRSVQFRAAVFKYGDTLTHAIDKRKIDSHGEQGFGLAGFDQFLAPGVDDGG